MINPAIDPSTIRISSPVEYLDSSAEVDLDVEAILTSQNTPSQPTSQPFVHMPDAVSQILEIHVELHTFEHSSPKYPASHPSAHAP